MPMRPPACDRQRSAEDAESPYRPHPGPAFLRRPLLQPAPGGLEHRRHGRPAGDPRRAVRCGRLAGLHGQRQAREAGRAGSRGPGRPAGCRDSPSDHRRPRRFGPRGAVAGGPGGRGVPERAGDLRTGQPVRRGCLQPQRVRAGAGPRDGVFHRPLGNGRHELPRRRGGGVPADQDEKRRHDGHPGHRRLGCGKRRRHPVRDPARRQRPNPPDDGLPAQGGRQDRRDRHALSPPARADHHRPPTGSSPRFAR